MLTYLETNSRLIDSWTTALKDAQSHFSSLLASSNAAEWRRINLPRRDGTSSSSSPRGNSFPKGKGRAAVESSDVIVHRKTDRRGDITRLVLDIPVDAEDPLRAMASWKAVLSTPETRQEWDPNVDASHSVEMLDPDTLISRVQFSLGWPARLEGVS